MRYSIEHMARRMVGAQTCRSAGATWSTPSAGTLHVARLIARAHPLMEPFLDAAGEGLVFDVGAHVGVYSVLAALRGARVVAVEPSPAANVLRDNAALNGVADRIHLVEAVASDTDGYRPFVRESSDPAAETGHVGEESRGLPNGAIWRPDPECVPVLSTRIMTLADRYGTPAALKIDVEGHEAEVLDGAGFVLSSVRALLLEIHPDRLSPGESERTLLERVRAAGLQEIARAQRGRQIHVLAIS